MIKMYENLLDCRQHLRDNIPTFIELFVQYYGEERRAEIEEKFSKVIYLAYRTPESTASLIDKIAEIISEDIITRYMSKVSTSLTKKDIFNYSFKNENIQPIKSFPKFLELYSLEYEERKKRFIEENFEHLKSRIPELTMEEYESMIQSQTILEKYSQIQSWTKSQLEYGIDLQNVDSEMKKQFNLCKDLLQKVDPNITIENFSEYMNHPDIQALIILGEQRPAMIQEFAERMKKYDSYVREAEQEKKTQEELSEQFFIKWIEENQELLTEEDLQAFEQYKNDISKSYIMTSHMRLLFGFSLSGYHLMDSFSEESNRLLEDPETSEWKKNTIKENRVNFFQRQGINLGDNYDDYLQNEEVQRLWPSVKQVQCYLDSRERLTNEYNIAYYSTASSHREAREEIEKLGFLDKDDSFNASIYTLSSGKTFVNPNVILTPEGYQLFSLVAVNCEHDTGHIDHDIIHELNHVFELQLTEANGSQYRTVCGWDSIISHMNQDQTTPIDTLHEDQSKRDYELFNEIINELIAQEICEIMKQKDIRVFDSEDNRVTKNVTSYEYTFFLIRDFFKEFKKEILESRSNGNIEIIWKKVGKENFDALNELFHIFHENFPCLEVYSLLTELKNNEDTEKTRIYHGLVEKRDQILEKMRKHSMMQEFEEVHENTDAKVGSLS